ncbi:hypothetical protein [Belliella calami]|nr:hypothetical protein [Belliella calami]
MPFITKQDLETHIWPEGMAVISRDDDDKINEAIQSAMMEASQYLTRYNTETIFSSVGTDKLKYANLITYIKDIAKWHFINVVNVQVDLELAESRYDRAIKALIHISKNVMNGWPLFEEDFDRPFLAGSNRKFNHDGF